MGSLTSSTSGKPLQLAVQFFEQSPCVNPTGEQRSRKKSESARTSEVNSEEDRVLSPIEEESESVASSVGTLGDFTISDDAEGSNYQTSVSFCDDHRKTYGDLDANRKPRPDASQSQYDRNWISSGTGKNLTVGENTCEEEEEFRYVADRRIPDRYKSVPEASGDNDEVQSRHHCERFLKTTLEWLKNRLSQTDREIVTLRKQLGLEKFHSRRFALQYHEKCMKAQELLKNDLLVWRNNLEVRMKAQMLRWRAEERKRTNDEIAKVTEVYSQEMLKTIQKDMKEWQAEDSKGIVEMIQSERARQELEAENSRKIYESIQGHLENLESRNRKSYLSFRKQIDAWEERLRDEIVKLHETNLRELQAQFKPWCKELVNNWCSAYFSRSTHKDEGESRKLPKSPKGHEQTNDFEENGSLMRMRDEDMKDLMCWIEEILKREIKEERTGLANRMNRSIDELWMAFEDFKHNFRLDRAYQKRCYVKVDEDEVDSLISEIFSESSDRRTLTIDSATNTDV